MRRCTFIDSWIIPSTRVAPRPPLVIEDDAEEENSVSPEYKRRSSLVNGQVLAVGALTPTF
ncbi:hypothetical protein H2248_012152 [Termitomyces sp. 'cryptogamus']|nr:hypothetical protein H2248_012152 [Termitomyces sp. 'cryptogamus']